MAHEISPVEEFTKLTLELIDKNDLPQLEVILAKIDALPDFYFSVKDVLIKICETGNRGDILVYVANKYGDTVINDDDLLDLYTSTISHRDFSTFDLLVDHFPSLSLHSQISCAHFCLVVSGTSEGVELINYIFPKLPALFTDPDPSENNDALIYSLVPQFVNRKMDKLNLANLMQKLNVVLDLYPCEISNLTVKNYIYESLEDLDLSYKRCSELLGQKAARRWFTCNDSGLTIVPSAPHSNLNR